MMFKALIALIFALPVVYMGGRWMAMRDCDNRHKVAQLEKTVEVVKVYEKIQRKVPYSADRAAKFVWLRDNASQ